MTESMHCVTYLVTCDFKENVTGSLLYIVILYNNIIRDSLCYFMAILLSDFLISMMTVVAVWFLSRVR